jgi:hypothetical protein
MIRVQFTWGARDLSTRSRSVLQPNQLPIQCLPRDLFTGIRWLGHEADFSSPYSATPPYVFMVWCLIKHRECLYFNEGYLCPFYAAEPTAETKQHCAWWAREWVPVRKCQFRTVICWLLEEPFCGVSSEVGHQPTIRPHPSPVETTKPPHKRTAQRPNQRQQQHWTTVGRALAQVVRRRLPTAMSRVRSQVRPCGISGGQSATGEDFLRARQFLLPIVITPTVPHSLIIPSPDAVQSRACTASLYSYNHAKKRNVIQR